MEMGSLFGLVPESLSTRWILRIQDRLGCGLLHPDFSAIACCGKNPNEHIG